MARFEDCFWGTGQESDWTLPYEGFDAMTKRLREGKSMSEGFLEFCKQRAVAEKAYGEAMVKLGSINVRDQHGDLRMAWDALLSGMMVIGRAHIELAKLLANEVAPHFKTFADGQRATRKTTAEAFGKVCANRAKAYERTLKTKKEYESKCKEQVAAETALANPAASTKNKEKELEKAKAKCERVRVSAECADTAYKDSVAHLDDVRVAWEEEYIATCRAFQGLEEKRIEQMKTVLAEVVRLHQRQEEMLTAATQSIEQAAAKVDVTNDIEALLADRQTGKVRPAQHDYVNFFGQGDTTQPSNRHTSLVRPDNGMANEVPVCLFSCRALYGYNAQGPEELSYVANSVLHVLSTSEEPWWLCVCNGVQGMAYKDYLERI